ncbi:hypothetical protein [Streptomyces sp. NRRL B-24572]|uniref:hypothetical protein n=1 Tax=Streptomyces sp. NRRL B-24572 TaxID=1962156 RepID=UPI000A3BDF5D|nr:hypothetical protein [Streptomyces sp. NRRL B-24572]
MRTALRTALATALVAGVVATPALAAGSAFAAGTTPAPKATATATTATAASQGTLLRTVQLAGGLSAKVYARGDQHPYYTATVLKGGTVLGELKAGAGYPKEDTRVFSGYAVTLDFTGKVTAVAVDAANGTLIRTVQLAGGLSAKVYAKGDQHPYYTATVLKGGTVLGDLKAGAGYPPKETKVFGGYAVTLDFEGNVTAAAIQYTGGTLVHTQTLIGGTVAKIYMIDATHHRAELYRGGHLVGHLDANKRSVAGNDNGEFLVLNSNGTTYNWVGNYRPGATPGIYKLADGTILELAEHNGRLGLQQLVDDKGRGFTYLSGDRQVFFYDRAVVVLERDGGIAAFIAGGAEQAAPQPYGMGGGGQGESGTKSLGKCTVSKVVGIGAGTRAELFMTRQGPVAEFSTAGEDRVFAMVDRTHPSLPESVGIIARIVDPKSATPSLYTKVEGGTAKGSTHAFPKLPKGCSFEVPIENAKGTGAGTTGTGTTTHTGQTSVIPQGGVAAGAEFAAEGDSTALIAVGAGAASLAAAGLGFVVLRRRAGSRA